MKSKLDYMTNIGNFTKIAVKNFEENIVDKVNYLESVNRSPLKKECKFEEDKNE
ncbi:hypothetical protein H9660_14825 [Clostridium sp. Sa3CUN1]|uniref:Uncharacterized protein n=1 Tax=Clostridium gallinarum TaxID=2762246 RepID=A0ABR8Q7K3_9CLOT|nr:hypothetical protein [Clostridium gallinarum]MBD7916415.1 hypothetical protein [Clostridium gallinarum]